MAGFDKVVKTYDEARPELESEFRRDELSGEWEDATAGVAAAIASYRSVSRTASADTSARSAWKDAGRPGMGGAA